MEDSASERAGWKGAGPPGGGDPEADRRAKLGRLREELGIDPYGGRVAGLVPLADALERYDADADEAHRGEPEGPDRRPVVKVAGRIVQKRVMGNLVFVRLRDGSGDLQAAVSKKAVDGVSFRIAKLADLGDIVVAGGPLGKTKTGEVTVWARGEGGFAMASKSLAPPPEKYHGLRDAEQRYRKRYVDLWANPEVMRTMRLRSRIVEEVRAFFRGRGFEEVETPMLQPIHGGAAARPFVTHHNALDMRLYLRIAPELYLKRLLVGGMGKVFEINRSFRNEGVSPRHNPEFTMIEAYEAFGSWETMADLVEELVCTVAEKVCGGLVLNRQDARGAERRINLERPWRRVRMVDLVEERTGWRFEKEPLAHDDGPMTRTLVLLARKAFKMIDADTGTSTPQSHTTDRLAVQSLLKRFETVSPAEQLVEVYEKLVEPTLIDPCFVTHVPSVTIPLAKESAEDPYFAEVYELAINGVEISPGYSELNDPEVQARHFREQVGAREEQQQVDEDFLEALRVGMPPAGGMGLGIDRLVMLLTGAPSIRDVILFPLMRPGR